jgi:hypothetical protein
VQETHAKLTRMRAALPPESAPASASVEKAREAVRVMQDDLHRDLRALEWQQSVRSPLLACCAARMQAFAAQWLRVEPDMLPFFRVTRLTIAAHS